MGWGTEETQLGLGGHKETTALFRLGIKQVEWESGSFLKATLLR